MTWQVARNLAHISYIWNVPTGMLLQQIPYIVRNFRILAIFVEKTFTDCSFMPCQRTPGPQILRKILLRIATKPQNLQKFTPSKVSRYMAVCASYLYYVSWQAKFELTRLQPHGHRSSDSLIVGTVGNKSHLWLCCSGGNRLQVNENGFK